MKRQLLATILLSVFVSCGWPVLANSAGPIQMLPPTPIGSMTVCPSGTQQVLSYSGAPQGGTQGGNGFQRSRRSSLYIRGDAPQ